MEAKDVLAGWGILYKVDPSKLSIKIFRTDNSSEDSDSVTTDYEVFSLIDEYKQFKLSLDKFPFEFKGLLYFLKEDDAYDFIKTQIGM